MTSHNDGSDFRRKLAGLCLIVGPLLGLLSSIITPEGAEENEEYLRNIADNTSAAEWGTTLGVFSAILLGLGIVGLVSAIRGRGATLANVAMIPAVLGIITFTALVTTTFFDVALVEKLSIGQAADVVDSAEDNLDGFIPLLIVSLLGTLIGFILLAIALIRSRVVPIAVPILILAGIVLIFLSEESKPMAIAASAAWLGAFGLAGLTLMRGVPDDSGPSMLQPRPAASTQPEAPPSGPPPA